MDEQDIGRPLAGTLRVWLVTVGALVGTAGTVVGFGGAPASGSDSVLATISTLPPQFVVPVTRSTNRVPICFKLFFMLAAADKTRL